MSNTLTAIQYDENGDVVDVEFDWDDVPELDPPQNNPPGAGQGGEDPSDDEDSDDEELTAHHRGLLKLDDDDDFVHGLCDLVRIELDNQKPTEHKYSMDDFLDATEGEDSDADWDENYG